jgi:hypothetical protein
MAKSTNLKVLFIVGFGPVVRDVQTSESLYKDTLNIQFKEELDGYRHTEALDGARTFALWPLSQASRSCFGKDAWPDEIPAPQAWLEFEVENVQEASSLLEDRGYRLLIKNKNEPWGQTVTRMISPEGLLIGMTLTPSLRAQRLTE